MKSNRPAVFLALFVAGWAGQHRKDLRGGDEPRWRSRRRQRLDRLDDRRARASDLYIRNAHRQNDSADPGPSQRYSKTSPSRRRAAIWRLDLAAGTVCAFMTVTGNGPRPFTTPTMATLSTVPHLPPMGGWPPRVGMARSGSMTPTSSYLSRRGRQPAGSNPRASHSAPTAACWRSATQRPRPWTSSTDVRWRRCQDRTLTACAMATWELSPGQRTAGPSTRAGATLTGVMTHPCWLGPMRVEASGAFCQPGAIQSRALQLCRTARSWLQRQIRS